MLIFFFFLGKFKPWPIEVALCKKAPGFHFHLVVEYCTNKSSLFFTKYLLKEKVRLSVRQTLDTNVCCFALNFSGEGLGGAGG